jgi:3-dehydroquinate synthase
MAEVRVELGERSYRVLIGEGLLARAADHLGPVIGEGRAAIVADEAVWDLHGEAMRTALPDAPLVTVPPGEASKSWGQLQRVCEALLASGVGRDGTVVAFGGGVTGDLAGLASALLRRGCRLVQVPTTLLSQVDSSVGGKTAINAAAGKNLIGAFHQPSLVLIDPDVLRTLPDRELRAGAAEVIKVALLGDEGFAAWIEAEMPKLLGRDPVTLTHAIATACRAKAEIVAEDEREAGRRALLNLGHTFGHAVEAAYFYDGRVLHGEAVGLGMAMAYRYAERTGTCPGRERERAEALIASAGLPLRLADLPPADVTPGGMLAAMRQDKKVEGGRVTLILPWRVGEARVQRNADEETLLGFLTDELA